MYLYYIKNLYKIFIPHLSLYVYLFIINSSSYPHLIVEGYIIFKFKFYIKTILQLDILDMLMASLKLICLPLTYFYHTNSTFLSWPTPYVMSLSTIIFQIIYVNYSNCIFKLFQSFGTFAIFLNIVYIFDFVYLPQKFSSRVSK